MRAKAWILIALAAACRAAPPASTAAPTANPVETAAPAAPAGQPAELDGLVSEPRALQMVRDLVAFGPRMGGTRSGDRAAEYLSQAFAAAGLPVRVQEDPEKWCHAESTWSVAIATDAEAEWTELASAWPYGYSPSADLVGCLSFDAVSRCAKPAVTLADSTPRANRAGPALVDGSTTSDGSYPVVQHLPQGDANPAPVFGLSRGDGAALRARLARGEHLHARLRLESTIVRARGRTVVATLAARAGAPPGHLLFCAHGDSDSGGPGADDNASGEATVLEIARAWSRAVASGLLPPPQREIRFAVWGSEIHSTRAYLARCEADGEPVLAVVNFDQAGFGSGADQLNIEPDDLPGNESFVRATLATLVEAGGKPGFPERWATNKSLGGTDSYVFSSAKSFRDERRPALTLFVSAWGKPEEHPRTAGMPGESWTDRDRVSVDYDLYYHSAGDTPENTTEREPWNMGWCARVGWFAARRWLAGLDAASG